jgi:hypothetical protein
VRGGGPDRPIHQRRSREAGRGEVPQRNKAQPASDPGFPLAPLFAETVSNRLSPLRASHSRRDLPASRFSTDRQAKPDQRGRLDVFSGMAQIPAPSGRRKRARVPVGHAGRRCGPGQKDLSPSSRAAGGPVQHPVERPRNPRGESTGISDTIDGGWPLTPYPPSCMARNQNWRPSYCRG